MNYDQIFKPETLAKLNKQSQENLKKMLGDKSLMQTMIQSQQLLGEIAEAEAPYREQLEELAKEMVEKLYPIIEEQGIVLDVKIVGINDVNSSLDEVISPESRRRIINGITQGAALKGAFSFYLFKDYLDAIDPTLIEKYNQIMKNSFGIYDDDNAIAMLLSALAQGHKAAGGSSKVILKEIKVNNPNNATPELIVNYIWNNKIPSLHKILNSYDIPKGYTHTYKSYEIIPQDKLNNLYKELQQNTSININESQDSGITIRARAICFPMLVHEIIKGLYELISLQGFKGTKDQNQDTVNKVDKLEHEPEDIKRGKFIFEALNNLFADSDYNDPRIREHFFVEIYQLDDEDFLEFIENTINGELTKEQIRWYKQVLKEIAWDIKDDDFKDTGIE